MEQPLGREVREALLGSQSESVSGEARIDHEEDAIVVLLHHQLGPQCLLLLHLEIIILFQVA